jgi:hypothetical protein
MAGEVASLFLSRMTVPILFYLSERKNHEVPEQQMEVATESDLVEVSTSEEGSANLETIPTPEEVKESASESRSTLPSGVESFP